MLLYTAGHSNRDFSAFAHLLRQNGIEAVADVRSSPGSKRFPHFNRGNLQTRLPEMGISYSWFRDLGGMKRGRDEDGSVLDGLQGYRAYMRDPRFQKAVQELLRLASSHRTAIMCAEKDPGKCHRLLLSRYLADRGHRVLHIVDEGELREQGLETS